MSASFHAFLSEALEETARANLLRTLRPLDSAQTARVFREGRELLNFSSNDYLGLANHPALREASRCEGERAGFGAGASRLVCGTLAAHEALEAVLAAFKKTEAAVCFSSGYAAAMGVIPAVCGKGDVLILDKLCHACLVDAARLSGAEIRVFPHNHLEKLESHLQWAARTHPRARVMILAESVYSMDGDLAPVADFVALKERFGAWLFLDEAHGVGVLGDQGRGLADAEGVASQVEIQMGTLGKALGAHGAYVAGNRLLREFLINRARSFIYSTAPPAPVAAAARRAIELLQEPEGTARIARLKENTALFSKTLGSPISPSAILPVLIGDEKDAMDAAARLLEEGFLIPAIRYPTVARGTARLRVTLSSEHRADDIRLAAEVVRRGSNRD